MTTPWIAGTGAAFPKRIATNEDFLTELRTRNPNTPTTLNNEWIVQRSGIEARHYIDPKDENETASALATLACKRALEMAGIDASEVDGIIVGTCSSDNTVPSTAVQIQQNLGCKNAWGYDVNAACSGFLFALNTGVAFLNSDQARTLLIVGVDIMSRVLDWQDPKSGFIFGDGAGAFVIRRPAHKARVPFANSWAVDGSNSQFLYIKPGESLYMNGREIFKLAVQEMIRHTEISLRKLDLQTRDINWLVAHQANTRILQAVSERLEIPQDRVVQNIARRGNTSAATIPTVFDEAARAGKIKIGDWVVTSAFGGGTTAGSSIFKYE